VVFSAFELPFLSSVIRIIQTEEAPYFLFAAFCGAELSPAAVGSSLC
jgi:hypothetical protein